MAQPTYTYYLERYFTDHQNRFNLALQMAQAEGAAKLEREALLQRYIVDLEKQLVDIEKSRISASSKGAAGSAAHNQYVDNLRGYITTMSGDMNKAIDRRQKDVDAIRAEYSSLPQSVATLTVSSAQQAIGNATVNQNYVGEVTAGAKRAFAGLGDKSEGQRLQAALSYANNVDSADVDNMITLEDAKVIAAREFGIPDVRYLDQIAQRRDFAVAQAESQPLEQTIDEATKTKYFEAVEATKPGAEVEGGATSAQSGSVKVQPSVVSAKDIEAKIKKAEGELSKLREDQTTIMDRGREIYQEEFAAPSRRDRRMIRQYGRMNTDEKLIAASLAMSYKPSKFEKAAESDTAMQSAADLMFNALQNPNPDVNPYQTMRELLDNDNDKIQLAIRAGIERFKALEPKAPEMPEDVKAATNRERDRLTKIAEASGIAVGEETTGMTEQGPAVTSLGGMQKEQIFPAGFQGPGADISAALSPGTAQSGMMTGEQITGMTEEGPAVTSLGGMVRTDLPPGSDLPPGFEGEGVYPIEPELVNVLIPAGQGTRSNVAVGATQQQIGPIGANYPGIFPGAPPPSPLLEGEEASIVQALINRLKFKQRKQEAPLELQYDAMGRTLEPSALDASLPVGDQRRLVVSPQAQAARQQAMDPQLSRYGDIPGSPMTPIMVKAGGGYNPALDPRFQDSLTEQEIMKYLVEQEEF